jgi:hypothetical protein
LNNALTQIKTGFVTDNINSNTASGLFINNNGTTNVSILTGTGSTSKLIVGGDASFNKSVVVGDNLTVNKNIAINGITAGLGGNSIVSNTVFGNTALNANTTGNQNVAIGLNAMQFNTTGQQNTAIGVNALRSITSGQKNTAVGEGALSSSYNVSRNTAIGENAGAHADNFSGSNNTFLGFNTQLGSNGLTNATAIGANAIVTASNTVQLGSGCDAQAQTFTATSDYRMKKNVESLDDTYTVDVLRPVQYEFISNDKKHVGFIAHEVQEHYPFLVKGEKDGPTPQSLDYNGFIGILTKEIKDLKALVRDQSSKLLDQEKRIQALENKL